MKLRRMGITTIAPIATRTKRIMPRVKASESRLRAMKLRFSSSP
jgi:hypothetical protein